MKIKLIICVLIILTGTIYFVADSHLFYYGESCFSFYGLLPQKIKPENRPDFEGGFVLWDNYEMSLVGKGVRCWQVDSITIEKIIKYGFNSDLLISEIIDTKGNIYFFEFSKNQKPAYKKDISVRLINEEKISTIDNLKWIDITDSSSFKKIVLARNLLAFVFIGLFITLANLIFRKKQHAAKSH